MFASSVLSLPLPLSLLLEVLFPTLLLLNPLLFAFNRDLSLNLLIYLFSSSLSRLLPFPVLLLISPLLGELQSVLNILQFLILNHKALGVTNQVYLVLSGQSIVPSCFNAGVGRV